MCKIKGNFRFDTEKELEILQDLYRNELPLYVNFFLPQMKLISKKRVNGKIKKYDKPKTPYKRVMECPEVSKEIKALNLSILYKDIEKKEVRTEPELKRLKKKINKKAP